MSDRKRPLPADNAGPSSKKPRSDATSSNQDLIAQKKAEIAAKLAAFKKNAAAPGGATVSAGPTAPSSPAPGGGGSSNVSDIAARIAEAKKKVAAAQGKVGATGGNPYMAAVQNKGRSRAPTAEPAQQGSGLKMAAHPLLLDTSVPAPQSKKDRYKPMQPKFASIKANARNAPTPPPQTHTPVPVIVKDNPYAQAAAEAAQESRDEGLPRERVGRSLRFNPKGKFIAQAAEIRREQQLEDLKRRIADSAKKAGLDSEFDTLEKKLKREPPPRAEWWDEMLLPTKNYEDIDNFHPSALNIRKDGSPINMYVQHPIPIPAPADKNKPTLKPLMLTKKELKKLRKRRRQEELQDKRDRVRMGLLAPDAPKVRLVNMMRVLTSDAVQDPTRVEAKVLREVAMRRHNHDKMNSERKLTDEQRREKVEEKKVNEEKKGLHGAIFKVKILTDPAHRFKVRKNAEQMNLTGVLIQNPSFSMVFIEGASKFVRNYKRLMINRIAWTEAARARNAEDVELDTPDPDAAGPSSITKEATPAAEEDKPVSLEENRCDLVWEGPLRDRTFATFRPKLAPTDNAAREILGQKLAGYWDMTKNFKPEDETLGI
ncbi:PRP3-domain-containing protein [Peniophora sp. CONT]|nr:PRP3-domain-containing protein [Peniophora sp. CONT]